jgi:hypothetical protein
MHFFDLKKGEKLHAGFTWAKKEKKRGARKTLSLATPRRKPRERRTPHLYHNTYLAFVYSYNQQAKKAKKRADVSSAAGALRARVRAHCKQNANKLRVTA